MKDHNDIEVIINNQRIIMAALSHLLRADGARADDEHVKLLDERLVRLNSREYERFS